MKEISLWKKCTEKGYTSTNVEIDMKENMKKIKWKGKEYIPGLMEPVMKVLDKKIKDKEEG